LNFNKLLCKGGKMPRGDGTGPAGMGPMTGRGAGYCAGYSVPGYSNAYSGRYPGGRRAFGGGFGQGRGYRNWYYAAGLPGWSRYNMGLPAWGGAARYPYYGDPYGADIKPEQEIEMLKSQSENIKQQLNDINKRIEEIKKEEKGNKKE
jgi:hypothetical protein